MTIVPAPVHNVADCARRTCYRANGILASSVVCGDGTASIALLDRGIQSDHNHAAAENDVVRASRNIGKNEMELQCAANAFVATRLPERGWRHCRVDCDLDQVVIVLDMKRFHAKSVHILHCANC
jgi:hypothetical protein